jgi:hypothetical protein
MSNYARMLPFYPIAPYKSHLALLLTFRILSTYIYNTKAYKSCLALLLTFRILSPYICNTKGIGIKAIDRNPNVELAQPTPRQLYIAAANNGNPAPKLDLIKLFPAYTEAA